MKAAAAIRLGAARLASAGIERPHLEARLLLAHLLGISQEALLVGPEEPVDQGRFDALLARRAGHEPLAFITGTREFWSLPFRVSRATLIPRPDSETLVSTALALFPDPDRVRRVLDLGTGTGCLLLAVLTRFAGAFGVGTDLVPDAARLAAGNAARLGLGDRAAFLVGEWDAALRGRFELVLCNPPYIETATISALMPEVAMFEPATALCGGADGLDAYRRIIPSLGGLLTPDGVAVVELGAGQADAVAALAAPQGLTAEAARDLGGTERVLVLRRRGV